MIIVGDIGNTETKVCLINSKNKIIKKIIFSSKKIDYTLVKKYLSKLNLKKKKIKKVLFCSVVPKSYSLIKNSLLKNYKIRSYELKELDLKKLINVKVNFKQIGSDRLANALGAINKKDNFIILDFGTATTFDVLIKKTYQGGVIAPGVRISLSTLSDSAVCLEH